MTCRGDRSLNVDYLSNSFLVFSSCNPLRHIDDPEHEEKSVKQKEVYEVHACVISEEVCASETRSVGYFDLSKLALNSECRSAGCLGHIRFKATDTL